MRRHNRGQVVPRVVLGCFRLSADSKGGTFPSDRDLAGRDQSISQIGAGPATKCSPLSLSRRGSLQKGSSAEGEGKEVLIARRTRVCWGAGMSKTPS